MRGENFYYIPAFPVKPLSTLGAGDAFSSTFVAGLMRFDWDIEKSLALAAINSASIVQSFGAQTGLKTFDELQEIILKKIEREPKYLESLQRDDQVSSILKEYRYPLARLRKHGLDAKLLVPKHCGTCGYGLDRKNFKLKINYSDGSSSVAVHGILNWS